MRFGKSKDVEPEEISTIKGRRTSERASPEKKNTSPAEEPLCILPISSMFDFLPWDGTLPLPKLCWSSGLSLSYSNERERENTFPFSLFYSVS